MRTWLVAAGLFGLVSGCGDENCFPTGAVEIDVTGTFTADPETPACRPAGEFLALPEPLNATIDGAGNWSFADDSLSIVTYPDECLFTLIQRFDGTDPAQGPYQDQLSYIALAQPAPDVWTGSGVLRRQYTAGGQCENRISGVTVTLTLIE